MSQAEIKSLKALIEVCAVSLEMEKQKGQLDCLSSLNVKYVDIFLIILIAISKIGSLELNELDPFQGALE